MPDLAQAAHLELAIRALVNRDRPALAGALASLDVATLDHLGNVLSHPLWAQIAAHYPALNPLPYPA